MVSHALLVGTMHSGLLTLAIELIQRLLESSFCSIPSLNLAKVLFWSSAELHLKGETELA